MRGVYRLTCDDPDLIYYGSSDNIDIRFSLHKSHYNKWKLDNTFKYCSSYKLFDAGGVELEMVFECAIDIFRREMEEIEQTYIDNDECVNDRKSFQTPEQRKKQKKAYQKEYMKTSEYKDYQKQYYLKKKQLKKSKVQ